MHIFQNPRTRNALIIVIVAVSALFGVELSEVALNDTVVRVIELFAIVGGVTGGISLLGSQPRPTDEKQRGIADFINDFDTQAYYADALAKFNAQNNTEYGQWSEISTADLIWHLSRYVMREVEKA
jgi:hypothetical protein